MLTHNSFVYFKLEMYYILQLDGRFKSRDCVNFNLYIFLFVPFIYFIYREKYVFFCLVYFICFEPSRCDVC